MEKEGELKNRKDRAQLRLQIWLGLAEHHSKWRHHNPNGGKVVVYAEMVSMWSIIIVHNMLSTAYVTIAYPFIACIGLRCLFILCSTKTRLVFLASGVLLVCCGQSFLMLTESESWRKNTSWSLLDGIGKENGLSTLNWGKEYYTIKSSWVAQTQHSHCTRSNKTSPINHTSSDIDWSVGLSEYVYISVCTVVYYVENKLQYVNN